MADDSKLKFRDPVPQDEGAYLTKPRTQADLEARIDKEPEPVRPGAVNPNPVGAKVEDGGTYVGTDPIYQNSSGVHGQPFDSQDGVEQQVEEALFKEHDLSDVDDSKKAADYGMGGEALKVGEPGGDTFRTILPGQEGYDADRAEAQNGQPMQVWHDEDKSASDDSSEEPEGPAQADNPGTNFGSTVTPPPGVEGAGDESDAAGDKPAKKAAAKEPKSS